MVDAKTPAVFIADMRRKAEGYWMLIFKPVFWQVAKRPKLIKRSLKIAVVVGTILNLINQWEGFVGTALLAPLQLALTYCVPFLVSGFAAASAEAERLIAEQNRP